MKVVIAAISALSLAAASQAAVIYSQNFDALGPAAEIPGWVKIGGFNGNVITDGGPTGNGTPAAFHDVWDATFGTATIVADTGVAYVPSTPYALNFDLYTSQTAGPASFTGDYTYELWAGDPSGGTLLGSGFYSVGTSGALNGAAPVLNTSVVLAGSGNLFLRLAPTNTPGGYQQIELDNIAISVIPEPATLGLLAGAGLLALRRR
jgi:hypothetical protein